MSSSLDLPPDREIDFGFGCVCVACVRACDAKLRERDDSAVAGGGRLQSVGLVRPVPPVQSGRSPGPAAWPGWLAGWLAGLASTSLAG